MIKKLRLKFICVNMLSVIGLLIVMALILSGNMRRQIVRERIQIMSRLAEEPLHLRLPVSNGIDEASLSWFSLERGENGELRSFGGGFDLSDSQLLTGILSAAESMTEPTGTLPDYDLRYFRATTPHGQKYIFSDLASERAMVHSLYRSFTVVGVISVAALFVLSLLLSDWAVRPMDKAWQQQKQFVADVSHELKTPLTVIMTNTELLQQAGYDAEQRQRFSASILAGARQMRSLVEGLLELARLDAWKEPILETLDISAIAEDCILPFEAFFFERGLILETEIEPGLHIRGNERLIRQVIDALLDNARKYSDPGTVRLTLRQTGRSCLLSLKNPSPEISREECRALFKRFYRRDEARTVSGSYGLGLSIAESIVTRCGGKIACEWAEGEICFSVSLPLVRGEK